MTTSTFSLLACHHLFVRRDVGHVGHAERLVAVHRGVVHVDRIAAQHDIDERPGGPLPAVDLVLPHRSTKSRCSSVESSRILRPLAPALALSTASMPAR